MIHHRIIAPILLKARARQLCLLVSLAMLAACTIPQTPYQKNGLMGGYEDESLGGNEYRITVQGNGVTPASTVQSYFYRRAHELADQHGFESYTVVQFEIGTQPWWQRLLMGYSAGVDLYTARGIIRLTMQPDDPQIVRAYEGDTASQIQVGLRYQSGDGGLVQDYEQADKWFTLAAASGDHEAAVYRDELEKKMTPAQIAEARKLASEWKPTSSVPSASAKGSTTPSQPAP